MNNKDSYYCELGPYWYCYQLIYLNSMIITIAIVLLVLWFFGFIAFNVLGGFIHILLVVAVILFLIRVIRGENPLK